MIIQSILQEQIKNLKILNKTYENIEVIIKSITEFKKHGITTEKLEDTIKSTENINLKLKLEDINTIYKKYEETIINQYIDEEDILTKLAENLDKSNMFKDSIVYIDEFFGFTKQEYDILRKILKQAKQVNITVCTDELEINNPPEIDIFYSNKEFARKIIGIAKKENVSVEKPAQLEKLYRFKNQELLHLEQNIYNINYKKYEEEPKNIQIFLASNPYSEIEYVARQISKLVREGMRYKDISIITKDVNSVDSLSKMLFKKYEIPVFIDKKSELTQNILVKYLLSIFEIFEKNWSLESVLNYVKSGFIEINQNDIYLLENYCIKYAISGNKWYKEPWQELEDIRLKIVQPLMELKNNIIIVNNKKTVKSMTIGLYEFLQKNNIHGILSEKIEKLLSIGEINIAKEYAMSIESVYDILDELIEFFNEQNISYEKYKEILKTGLAYKELGNIPEVLDQVILGDVERSKTHKVKAVFIIGLNDGIFPAVNRDEGFLNDKDREEMKALGTEIAKGAIENLYEDQFNIYKAFSIAEEKIFLSYQSTNKEGKALRSSVLLSKIKKIFSKTTEKSDVTEKMKDMASKQSTFESLLININKSLNGEEIDSVWYDVYNWYMQNEEWKVKLENSLKAIEYSNIPEQVTLENIKKLYGNNLKTSISKLEQYRKCPFSFHLKYGLKIKEKDEMAIKSIDTGSFMHDIIDEFFKTIDNVENLEEKDIEKIVSDIIEEKLLLNKNYIFSSKPKFIVLTKKLKKTVTESIKYIVYQMQNSNFKLLDTELEFSEKIDNIELTGKIDRLDIAENAEGSYIRIIDYKSSSKNIDLNEVVAGLQIQLLTYINAISEKENKIPAGVFYFNLINPIVQSNKNLSDEEIKQEIMKQFKMKGLVLSDIKVIKMMDKQIEKGASNSIPVYIDKDGNISKTRSNVIEKEDFINLQKKVKTLIKQISKEILSGNINIKPMYNCKTNISACEYCKYKTICTFDSKINTYEYLKNKPKEEILKEIKEE